MRAWWITSPTLRKVRLKLLKNADSIMVQTSKLNHLAFKEIIKIGNPKNTIQVGALKKVVEIYKRTDADMKRIVSSAESYIKRYEEREKKDEGQN